MTISKKQNTNLGKQTLGPIVEPTPRWIRVKVGGQIIANSRNALLHRQYGGAGKLPTYYFPKEDVNHDVLMVSKDTSDTGGIQFFNIITNDSELIDSAWSYIDPPAELAELKNYYSFEWNSMDAWYEEEEQIFVHARDPYSRVDVLKSSRHVCIKIGDKSVADTHRPYLLFETGLPTRFYIPKDDVNMHYLIPTELQTQCPYKGIARYWSIDTGDQILKKLCLELPGTDHGMSKNKRSALLL